MASEKKSIVRSWRGYGFFMWTTLPRINIVKRFVASFPSSLN